MLYHAVQQKANAAIVQHLSHWLSAETAEAIKDQYGFATFTLVQQLYQDAVSMPADWATYTLAEHLEQVAENLRTTHPFLTDESIRRLVNCDAYSWK